MEFEFLEKSIDGENFILPRSDKINDFLLKNNEAEILKILNFFASDEKFLQLHGFLGTGKRQIINYSCEFLHHDVIKLEYYCKAATVCDDILLNFIDKISELSIAKAVNLNAKIASLAVRFKQQISSIKKPFVIVLHTFDDILEDNIKLVSDCINDILQEDNVKIIISTRAMQPSVMDDLNEDRKVFAKALTKDNFKNFIQSENLTVTGKLFDDFYNCTRGYYYYTALAIKIIQAMKIEVSEFLQKYNQSGMSFDAYLGVTYVNLIPTTIRNFFWFLRTIRHGLTLNALAVFEIYDDFSIEFLKSNLMIFQVDETVYVQDFFLQKIDISIPVKTEIKLHKYIVSIYEKQLKENLKDRVINISRQAMRGEIEYHNLVVHRLETGEEETAEQTKTTTEASAKEAAPANNQQKSQIESAATYASEKNYTKAIEAYTEIINTEGICLRTLVDARLQLAKLYKEIEEYTNACHYYELVEMYYSQHNEFINLNYLYYDMTDLYYKMYKVEKAIKTIKKVIYSVDTPQSLMVDACTLLGNIYAETGNVEDAFCYYKQAIDSLDENTTSSILAELYFKYALVCDDKNDIAQAFEYYNKCIAVRGENLYKASSYSNLASCYYENESYDDALNCFKQAYKIEKENNNYDGVYYTASYLAKLMKNKQSSKTLKYLTEAQQSAEFLNEGYYIIESTLALGDYYYNSKTTYKEALREYYKALKEAEKIDEPAYFEKIIKRIEDMRLRMEPDDFKEIEKKYEKQR